MNWRAAGVHAGPAGQPRISTTAADAAAQHRGKGKDQQDAGDRREHVVEPLQEVAGAPAAEEAGQRPSTVPMDVATSAAIRPTKTETCCLHRLASTSRPAGRRPAAGLAARAPPRLELCGALVPFFVARRQRVDGGQVGVRPLGHSPMVPGAAVRRAPTKLGGALGTPHLRCQSPASSPAPRPRSSARRPPGPATPCRRGRCESAARPRARRAHREARCVRRERKLTADARPWLDGR